MSVPMRKDEAELEPFEEDLTTADLAQGKRPAVSKIGHDQFSPGIRPARSRPSNVTQYFE